MAMVTACCACAARMISSSKGVTELFFESAEPLCWDDGSGDETVTLEEFIDRFEAGVYTARGRTLDGERLRSRARFTHNIPCGASG